MNRGVALQSWDLRRSEMSHMQFGGNVSMSHILLTFKYFAMLLSFPHQALHCHFPALGNTTKNKKLQSKLQVWLPPLALRAADKSSFHCVKGIQSAEQCKLAGPFSFQREAQSKLF